MKGNVRTIAVLAEHYFMDVVKNPGLLVCCLFPIAFVLFFRMITEGAANSGFMLAFSLLFVTSMVPETATIYPMGEEKEQHALRTLELAGVSRGQTLAARGFAAAALTIIGLAGVYLAAGLPIADLGAFLLLGSVSSISLILFSLLLGLATRNQMAASLYSVPAMVVGLAPMILGFSQNTAGLALLFPTGGALQLANMIAQGTLFTPEAILPIVFTLVWVLILAVVFAALAPRLIHKERP